MAAVVAAYLPMTAVADPAPACGPVEIVAFRGSGEGKVAGDGNSNGFEGSTLQRIIKATRETKRKDGFTLAKAQVYGVPYPAVSAEKYLDKDVDLFDSVEQGRLLGGSYLHSRHELCPTTKFLIMGYSQGVLAAREAVQDVPSDWIAGLVGFGDPAQKPNAQGVTGSGAHGNGVFRFLIEKDGKSSTDHFYTLPIQTFLMCHDNDPICDFTNVLTFADLTDHLNYGNPGEAAGIGAVAAHIAAKAAAAPPPADSQGRADVVFAIDTTGSMSPYLAAATESAARTADALYSATDQARVGLVEYRDHGDAFTARTVVPLTEDFAAFDAGLATLVADGGGDTPEAVYSGIVTALKADWDRSAARSLIVLGDAPAHDPEPVTGLTAASVTEYARGTAPLPALPPTIGAAAKRSTTAAPGQEQTATPARRSAAEPVAASETIPPVSVYALSANPALTEQMTPISTATSGSTTSLDSPGGVTEGILDAVKDAASAPVARLNAAGTALAGSRTVLSGLASTYSDSASFGYDFDGDGTIDHTTTEPAVTHIYTEVGEVSPRLVITDSRGRTSQATERIEVRATDSLQRPAPTSSETPTSTPSASSPQSTPTAPSSVPHHPRDRLPDTGVPALTATFVAGAALLLIGTALLFVVRRRRHRR